MRSKLFNMTAADYEGMFASVWAGIEQDPRWLERGDPSSFRNLQTTVTHEIEWAKRVLKKNDRIVWWLRWIKLTLEKEYLPAQFTKDWAGYVAKAQTPMTVDADGPRALSTLIGWHRVFEHFFSLPCPEISAFQPGYLSWMDARVQLQRIEAAWQADRKSVLRPQEGDREVIKFPDGWAWWLLDRHACDDESRAMGHCGNGASSDKSERILSLRQPKGKNEWEPHLTFIMKSDGTLGEMKGKNNDKPVARYHPYIIKLLENPIVKGITGGGYKPQHNFSMQDLPEAERQDIFKQKPVLMSVMDYYQIHGMDDTCIQKVIKYFEAEQDEEITWDVDRKKFIIARWSNLSYLVTARGNMDAKWIINIINGSEDLDLDSGVSREQEAERILDELGRSQREKIGEILMREHETMFIEWKEDNDEDEDFHFTRTKEIISFAEYAQDDLLDNLADAYRTGYQVGTETEMVNALRSALSDSPYEPIHPQNQGGYWDNEWVEVMDPAVVIKVVADGDSIASQRDDDVTIDVEESRNGFWDFDKNAALERFSEDYDIEEKHAELFPEFAMASSHPARK